LISSFDHPEWYLSLSFHPIVLTGPVVVGTLGASVIGGSPHVRSSSSSISSRSVASFRLLSDPDSECPKTGKGS